MIRMIHEEHHQHGEPDLYCPKVFCDYCEELIRDAREGNFLNPMFRQDTGEVVRDGPIVFVHKGRCDRSYEAEHPEYRWGSGELWWFPIQLGTNLGLDWAKDIEEVRSMPA